MRANLSIGFTVFFTCDYPVSGHRMCVYVGPRTNLFYIVVCVRAGYFCETTLNTIVQIDCGSYVCVRIQFLVSTCEVCLCVVAILGVKMQKLLL